MTQLTGHYKLEITGRDSAELAWLANGLDQSVTASLRAEGVAEQDIPANQHYDLGFNNALGIARAEIAEHFDTLVQTYTRAQQQYRDSASDTSPEDAVLALIDQRVSELKR